MAGSGFFRSVDGTAAFASFTPRPAWAERLAMPSVPGLPGLVKAEIRGQSAQKRVVALFDELHVDIRLGGHWRTELVRNAIERSVLLAVGGRRESPLDPRIQQALETIAAAPAGRFTVEELARAAHLSRSRFSHLFASVRVPP